MLGELFNATVAQRIGEHLLLTLLGLLPAVLVAVPAGLWIGSTGRGRTVVVAFSGALRAIPSLGLLTAIALFLPGGAVDRAWLPTMVVLAILAIPPVLAGTYAGVQQIKPSVLDAARATGHSPWQILRQVQIPLALPQMLDGIRSAASQVLAAATLCAYIGTGGLGRYLIDGIAQRSTTSVVVGVVWVIVLVVLLEATRAIRFPSSFSDATSSSNASPSVSGVGRSRLPAAVAWVSVLAICGVVVGGTMVGGAREDSVVKVGAANFPESEIIAQIYVQALVQQGIDAELVPGIGARDAYLAALENGEIDVVPEYVGNAAQFYDDAAIQPGFTTDQAAKALDEVLPEGLEAEQPAPAESKDSYRILPDVADRFGVRTLDDLQKLVQGNNGELHIGGTPELSTRPYGPKGLADVYDVSEDAMRVVPISDGGGPLTVQALLQGSVDVADIYTTTPVLDSEGREVDVVTLEDPQRLVAPQNVVPLLRSETAGEKVRAVLNALQKKLTTEDLREMNLRNSGPEKFSTKQVAEDWLAKHGVLETAR